MDFWATIRKKWRKRIRKDNTIGNLCYKVMPFGLKNVRATCQKAMVTPFHDMVHKEIEVYVDDMIAKPREGENHVQILKELS